MYQVSHRDDKSRCHVGFSCKVNTRDYDYNGFIPGIMLTYRVQH